MSSPRTLTHMSLLRYFYSSRHYPYCHLFFFNDPATTEIYTLSLHDALPIWAIGTGRNATPEDANATIAVIRAALRDRSEEHTSELQSHHDLVCRLLLEKKKKNKATTLSKQNSTHRDVPRSCSNCFSRRIRLR